MHLSGSRIPQCILQIRYVHICFLNGVWWDLWDCHSLITPMNVTASSRHITTDIAYLTYAIYQTISDQSTVSISEHPSWQFATGHVVIMGKTRTQAHVVFVLGQVLTCLLHGSCETSAFGGPWISGLRWSLPILSPSHTSTRRGYGRLGIRHSIIRPLWVPS